MQVEDYLEFAAQLHQVSRNSIDKAVDTVLEKTGLGDVRSRLIANLSKGFKQRVGLAQALIHNPQVLILDEPTVGLDPKQIIEIRQLIKGLQGDHTVILSSHILPEVTATCQRIIVINKGRIAAEDSLERLTTRLKKGLVYTLHVKNASSEGIQAIRGISGVTQLVTDGNKMTVEIASGTNEIRDQIIETAVTKKMGVLEFAAERVSLEDIFLQLTTEEN
jgi:ABC-2 type transport system ATP-binding protein